MANMLDYIVWRGDLNWNASGMNEIDALILAQLAMAKWEHAPGRFGLLGDLSGSMTDEDSVSAGFTGQSDRKLLALVHTSARFGAIQLTDYVNEVDREAGIQFSAVTLHLPDGSLYVAYRGTDLSVVGWKEDFALSFDRPTPAQEAALRYLTEAVKRYDGPVCAGGHSKGGNLAMFAASQADEKVRARIRAIYNFDGPGLSDQMDTEPLYARIDGKLCSFVPQGSMIGLLLAHPDEYRIVKSTAIGLLQHDPYSWQVEGPRFLYMPSLSLDSVRFDRIFQEWMKRVDEGDREALTHTLFGFFDAADTGHFGAKFWLSLVQNPLAVQTAVNSVPREVRTRALRAIKELWMAAIRSWSEKPALDPTGATDDDDDTAS